MAYNEDIYLANLIFKDAYAIAVFLELLSSKFYLCDNYPLITIMGQIVLTLAWKYMCDVLFADIGLGAGVLSCIASQLLLFYYLSSQMNTSD